MDKETKLAIICFGILPFVVGSIFGYFSGLTSYNLFLYALIHPIALLVIIYLAAMSAERNFTQPSNKDLHNKIFKKLVSK